MGEKLNKIISLREHSLSFLLIVFYTTEATSKIVELTQGKVIMLPRLVKLMVLGLTVIAIGYKQKKRLVFIFLLPLIMFLLGQWSLENSFTTNAVITFGKYIFPLLLFSYFTVFKIDERERKTLFKIFENIMVLNSFLVFVGITLDIRIFETYDFKRFGYNGLLLTSATSTYVYFVSIGYCLFGKKDSLNSWKFWIRFGAALLVGTKALYISLFLMLLYQVYLFVPKKLRMGLLGFAAVIACAMFYLLFYQIDIFVQIREEKGLLTAILSGRDRLLYEDTLPDIQQNWNALNYVFGGVSDIQLRSEMSFIDLFYFFGVIGGIYYFILYLKTYFSNNKLFKHWGLFILLVAIVFVAGNFFFYATVPIYLLILKERLLYEPAQA